MKRAARIAALVVAAAFAAVAIFAGTVVAVMAARPALGHVLGPARVVKARQFALMGPGGARPAVLRVLPDGTADLSLWNWVTRKQVSIVVKPDGHTGMAVSEKDRIRRAWVSVLPDGRPYLGLAGAKENVRAMLLAKADGETFLGLMDEEMKQRAALGATAGGTEKFVHATLSLCDDDSTLRAEFTLLLYGVPTFSLLDEDATPRAGLTVFPYGMPVFSLWDDGEVVRCALGLRPDGSARLELDDKSGKTLFRAP